jgi:hypothetical protein
MMPPEMSDERGGKTVGYINKTERVRVARLAGSRLS